MATSESSGYWSSSASLVGGGGGQQTNSRHHHHSHRHSTLYIKSEPKPILTQNNNNNNNSNHHSSSYRRRARNNNFTTLTATPPTISSTTTTTTTAAPATSSTADPIKRLEPLTVEEYELSYRLGSTDLELIERVFLGSFADNQLRAALWPYLFGLIVHRGRFERVPSSLPISSEKHHQQQQEYVFIEHEANAKRWLELEQMYASYESQWKAITRDQEERFTLFRERKALIGRDVIRCDRLHAFYAEQPRNLDLLSSLLMTYMMFDFDIGYVQGMSDLAGPILYIFDGDLVKAFWVFVEVMKLVRRNFEHTQTSIHFQLSCLFNLIHITDPKFAKYLQDQESSNCFFAFRAIVCQFKRELMKDEADYYDKCLQLWDTIWCVERRCVLEANLAAINQQTSGNDSPSGSTNSASPLHHKHNTTSNNNNNNNNNFYHGASWNSIPNYLTSFSNHPLSGPMVVANKLVQQQQQQQQKDPSQPDTPRHNLTETEIFILALCLVMILRERDAILSNRLDGNDIHLHFIEPKLAQDLNGYIQSAINTYRIMKNDLDMKRLTNAPSTSSSISSKNKSSSSSAASKTISSSRSKNNAQHNSMDDDIISSHLAPLIKKNIPTSSTFQTNHHQRQSPQPASSSSASTNVLEEFLLGSPGSLEGYDFLNDFLIIQRKDQSPIR